MLDKLRKCCDTVIEKDLLMSNSLAPEERPVGDAITEKKPCIHMDRLTDL